MLSLPLQLETRKKPRPAQVIPGEWRGILNALRVTALDCRVAARMDLFHACALLSNKENTARDAYSQALLKCLSEAISTKPVFFQPGTVELSFDEAWLIRALIASRSGDGDSLAFLIRSRVPKMYQRQISFLIKGISDQFSRI
jgi:hypothetical protein